jgi:hypothetical protein
VKKIIPDIIILLLIINLVFSLSFIFIHWDISKFTPRAWGWSEVRISALIIFAMAWGRETSGQLTGE